MKKLALMLLILVFILSSLPAQATGTGTYGKGSMVVRSGELGAFMDANGHIYVSGLNSPVNTTPAQSLVSIDPYRILFFAKPDAAPAVPAGRLISLKLDDFSETIVTDDALAACARTEQIYYISLSDSKKLICHNLDSGTASTAFTGLEAIERIYSGENGVIATLMEGAGAYIQDENTGLFIPYNGNIAAESALFENFEIYLTDSRELYALENGSLMPVFVDSGIQAWAVIENTVYYLATVNGNTVLKSYDVLNRIQNTVLTPGADMQPQLTASAASLFMISDSNVVYSVDTSSSQLVHFTTLPAPDSFSLGTNQVLSGYQIEAVSGQLNLYGIVQNTAALPAFTFVNSTSQVVSANTSGLVLLSAYTIDQEDTVWALLQPAPQFSPLRKGNRGDAVAAIQQPLYDLGYYDYRIDGIFGWRTQRAVELLQADLNLPMTGIADEQLQQKILSGTLQPYNPYRALVRGDRGYRVREMQVRLRDLGYLADDADGVFGARTQSAVLRFQEQHRLNPNGDAGSDTLRSLYSASAQACTSYIDLESGDSGHRVRELNNRLKELFYLEGEAGSSYTKATANAVRRFQAEIGMQQSGKASSALLQQLFSRKAPEYSGYITLQRGDQNARVKDLQRRLNELGYYKAKLDSYFGRETLKAVKSFQSLAGLKETGIADPITLSKLYRADAPQYREPAKIKAPVIELSAYSRFEQGYYLISDFDTTEGSVNVSWYSEGDVAAYDIRITDDHNTTYIDVQNTSMTAASVPVSSLDPQRSYIITVTAHPADTRNDQSVSSSICFIRLPEPVAPDPEEIGTIGELIVAPDGDNIAREDGIYRISGETFSFKWNADGDVAGYAYTITDSNGNALETSAEISSVNSISLNASALNPDETYVLSVYAIPENGTISDAVTESIRFSLQTEAPAPTPTPEPSQEPETPDLPLVSAIGTPEIRVETAVGTAFMEVLSPEGKVEGADVIHLAEGTIDFSWYAEGDVSAYNVRILDANLNEMLNQDMVNTNASISSGNLEYGMLYSLTVTAYASDAQTNTQARIYFVLPAPALPIEDNYQPESTEEPVPDFTEEPMLDPTEEPVPDPTEEPVLDPTEEPVPDPTEEPVPDPTEEPVPDPTEEPVPDPTEEPVPDPTEEPVPDPTEEPAVTEPGYDYPAEPITPESNAEAILALQQRLAQWFWLPEDGVSGVLDEMTVQAVSAFQEYANASGLSVQIIDPLIPVVETDTLRLLFNADGIEIANPYA